MRAAPVMIVEHRMMKDVPLKLPWFGFLLLAMLSWCLIFYFKQFTTCWYSISSGADSLETTRRPRSRYVVIDWEAPAGGRVIEITVVWFPAILCTRWKSCGGAVCRMYRDGTVVVGISSTVSAAGKPCSQSIVTATIPHCMALCGSILTPSMDGYSLQSTICETGY